MARKVYYGQCDSSYYKPSKSKLSRIKKAAIQFFFPQILLEDAASISGNYSTIYIGMCDEPRRMLCSYLSKHQNVLPNIVLYDEGIGTYREDFERAYYNWWHGRNLKGRINTIVYRDNHLAKEFQDVYVFDPSKMIWSPYGEVKKIHFKNAYYRKDIGKKALQALK